MKIILFFWLVHIVQVDLGESTRYSDETFGRRNQDFYNRNDSSEADESIRHIEEEVSRLNKTGDVRDKRALGILLQGIMEALGYTVSPIQLAAIPAASAPAGSTIGMMMSSTTPMNASTAPPRQRETLRFTGVLNFGNNLNTTNLVNHLAQYEQLFHGNRTTAPPPTPAPAPQSAESESGSAEADEEELDIDPVPLTEPVLVKIPLPIAPDLPPPQQPMAVPEEEEEGTYREEEYGTRNSEEYQGAEEDDGKQGNYEEERENHSRSEEYENKREQEYRPENRNYQPRPPLPPPIKSYEKEYKKNENVVNYSIENKEIRDPSEVSEEVPRTGSKFGHAMYVGEPDWKQKHDDHAYRLAAEQEARVEALAEENAEREKDKSRDYEMTEDQADFHQSREKEIVDRYENQRSKYDSKEKMPFFDDDEEEDEPKRNYDDVSEAEDDFEEAPEKLADDAEIKEGTNKILKQQKNVPKIRGYKKNSNGTSEKPKQLKHYSAGDQKNERMHVSKQMGDLPISYSREKLRRDPVMRDSYGESLEKPGGGTDERVSGYFSMFKNPHTGVYDPNRIQQFDYSDLIQGFEKIQKEYGSPVSKYEEYEIDDEDNDDKVEHRAENNTEDDEEEDDAVEPVNNSKATESEENKRECGNCTTAKKTEPTSKESRTKLSSKLTPPSKSEDSVGYGPYYSNILYEPLEYDQGIISRLTSFGPPTIIKFKDQNQSPSLQEKGPHSVVRPTPVGLPEKLTLSRKLVQEVETKEYRAWPPPFDYVYDNMESKNVAVKKVPAPRDKLILSDQPRPFESNNGDNVGYQNTHALPPQEAAKRVRMLLKEHENNAYNAEKQAYRLHPEVHQSDKKLPQNTRLIRYFPNVRSTQATNLEQATITTDPEKSTIDSLYKNHSPTYSPVASESVTTLGIKKIPKESNYNHNVKLSRRIDENNERSEEDRLKPNFRSTFDKGPGKDSVRRKINVKKKTENYVEKAGTVLPESAPYFYNEEIHDVTDQPENNKINVKEYRNRVETIKLSELKQFHPEGSVQFVNYERYF